MEENNFKVNWETEGYGVKLTGERMKGQFKRDCKRGFVGDRAGIKGVSVNM